MRMKSKEEIEKIAEEKYPKISPFNNGCIHGFIAGYTECVKDMEAKWISVEDERKPQHKERVLVRVHPADSIGQTLIAFYKNEKFDVLFRDQASFCEDVTHWMPLPSSPYTANH